MVSGSYESYTWILDKNATHKETVNVKWEMGQVPHASAWVMEIDFPVCCSNKYIDLIIKNKSKMRKETEKKRERKGKEEAFFNLLVWLSALLIYLPFI